jgi:hypothetical protein
MNTNLQGNTAHHFNKNSNIPLTLLQRIKRKLMKGYWVECGYCPRCGNKELGKMKSLQLNFCPDCYYWFPWSTKAR